jgi:hypothetical protein
MTSTLSHNSNWLRQIVGTISIGTDILHMLQNMIFHQWLQKMSLSQSPFLFVHTSSFIDKIKHAVHQPALTMQKVKNVTLNCDLNHKGSVSLHIEYWGQWTNPNNTFLHKTSLKHVFVNNYQTTDFMPSSHAIFSRCSIIMIHFSLSWDLSGRMLQWICLLVCGSHCIKKIFFDRELGAKIYHITFIYDFVIKNLYESYKGEFLTLQVLEDPKKPSRNRYFVRILCSVQSISNAYIK